MHFLYEIFTFLHNVFIKKLLIYALTRWLMGNNFIWTSCLRLWRHIWHFDFKHEMRKKSEVQVYVFSHASVGKWIPCGSISQTNEMYRNYVVIKMLDIQSFTTNCTVILILTYITSLRNVKISQNRKFGKFLYVRYDV